MKHSSEMFRIIRELDAEAAIELHRHMWPHLPDPANVFEARATLHLARTSMKSMKSELRCYSHAWLRDHGLTSLLPDNLKKKADRLYPVGVGVVALAVKNRDERALGVLEAMTEAVQETYADGHSHQPQVVKARILEKREQFLRDAGGVAVNRRLQHG